MDTAFDPFDDEDDAAPEDGSGAAGGDSARASEIETLTLDDLAEMRAVGMGFIRRLEKRASGQMSEAELKGMERVGDDCVAFERMARAVRQIVALEQETVGIRPMPQAGGGSAGGSGGDKQHSGGANDNASRRESLRTGSTRGARNDLKDAKDKADADYQKHRKNFMAMVGRLVAAADMDLRAAGKGDEVAKASPAYRVTVMIYAVPRPNFEACLAAMSLEPMEAATAALIRKMGKPGTYRPPHKPP